MSVYTCECGQQLDARLLDYGQVAWYDEDRVDEGTTGVSGDQCPNCEATLPDPTTYYRGRSSIRSDSLVLRDLRGENALKIVGTIGRLLRRLDRESGANNGLREQYESEAMTGDYDHLCAVSESYARQWLRQTLDAHEGDLTCNVVDD